VKKFVVSALAVAALAGSALGQAQPVRLEFRIVPQTGTVTTPAGTGIVDSALTTAPGPTLTSGSVQRYALQYRVLDLDPSDAVNVPAGLSACSINITISGAGGAGGSLAAAQLTRFQAQLANTTPPASPDVSGLPTGAAAVRTGMNTPYRGGFSDANNNALPSNGTVVPGGITGILPLAISQTNQGNANNGIDNTAWYGLYTFNLTVGTVAGNYTVTAEATADPGSGNRFGWFNDGVAVPAQSANATTGVTHFRIVPAPGAFALLGLGGLVAGRRRRA
jgi:uncharacterized protein (TIGR03382 family)